MLVLRCAVQSHAFLNAGTAVCGAKSRISKCWYCGVRSIVTHFLMLVLRCAVQSHAFLNAGTAVCGAKSRISKYCYRSVQSKVTHF